MPLNGTDTIRTSERGARAGAVFRSHFWSARNSPSSSSSQKIDESAVLNAINTRMIATKDFVRAGQAVALTPTGRRGFFQAYEARMDTLVTHPILGYRVSFVKHDLHRKCGRSNFQSALTEHWLIVGRDFSNSNGWLPERYITRNRN